MKKHIVLLIPFILLLVQCHKEPTSTFIKMSGKVLEYGTNKPIANAKVGIYEEGGEFLGATWTRLLDTTRTDANGFYYFDKPNLDKGSSFFIAATANKYYAYDPNSYLITGQVVTNNDIVLDPFAWIKVHVKNVNPFDDRDSIFLDGIVGTLSGIHIGNNVDLNYVNTIRGNRPMEASWTIIKNNIRKIYADTLRINAHDTLKYQIFY